LCSRPGISLSGRSVFPMSWGIDLLSSLRVSMFCIVCLGDLAVAQLVMILKYKGSLPCTQKPTIGPTESSKLHPRIARFNIVLPSCQVVSSLQVFSCNFACISHSSYSCYISCPPKKSEYRNLLLMKSPVPQYAMNLLVM
jgi:hypothetical protein